MNPVTGIAVFVVDSLFSGLGNSKGLYKSPQCFLYVPLGLSQSSTYFLVNANPEPHWHGQAWAHIPPNWRQDAGVLVAH